MIIKFRFNHRAHFVFQFNPRKWKRKVFIWNLKYLHQFTHLHQVKQDSKSFKVTNVLPIKKGNSVKPLNQKVWIELQSIKLILQSKKQNWMLRWKLKTFQRLHLQNKINQSKIKLKLRQMLMMKKSFMRRVHKDMLIERSFNNSISEWKIQSKI